MLAAEKLNSFLKDHHVDYEVIGHAETFTVQKTAQAEHLSGKKFAKVVMLKADGKDVMAVIPGHEEIDLERTRNVLNAKELRLSSESEFRDLFPGCETGAMPPFGNLYDLPVYVDRDLAGQSEIIFNSGSHRTTIKMKYQDYEELVHPKISDVAKLPS